MRREKEQLRLCTHLAVFFIIHIITEKIIRHERHEVAFVLKEDF